MLKQNLGSNSSINLSLWLHLWDCTALILKCCNLWVPSLNWIRSCSFHLNSVIKADPHLQKDWLEQLWPLWASTDCNTKFSWKVKWMWTASALPRLNHSITFQWLSDSPVCAVYWWVTPCGKQRLSSTCTIECWGRLTLQIRWNWIITKQCVILRV